MPKIVMNASHNKEYMEENGELLAEEIVRDGEDTESLLKSVRHDVYISPEEHAKLVELYSHSIVQDFEDDYHMPEKEREEMRKRYAKFFQLRQGYTKKIRKIDDYVKAYRLIDQIIWDTANRQKAFRPEKFVEKVYKGEIEINGLHFPKYQGKGKKSINWEHVAEFVQDQDLDLKELTHPEEVAEETIKPDDNFLIPPENLKELLKPPTKEEIEEAELDVVEDRCGDKPMVAVSVGKKDRRALMKVFPHYTKLMKDIRKAENNKRANARIWELTSSEMDAIQEYEDRIAGKKIANTMPEFKGSILNDKDVNAYLYKMEEWERTHTYVEYNGRNITMEEKEDIEMKEILERNGWNLRAFWDNREIEKKKRDKIKSNKKKVKDLKKMLEKIQSKTQALENGEELESKAQGGVNKKKKKKKKLSKDLKKKKKTMNRIIMDAVTEEDTNMKEYKEAMKNFVWDFDNAGS